MWILTIAVSAIQSNPLHKELWQYVRQVILYNPMEYVFTLAQAGGQLVCPVRADIPTTQKPSVALKILRRQVTNQANIQLVDREIFSIQSKKSA